MSEGTLAGRRALVSGAGAAGGIGFAIARELKTLGAEVTITSTTNRIKERAAELGVAGFIADLTNAAECSDLIAKIGTLDILVNNAGMSSISTPMSSAEVGDLTEISGESWRVGISRNLDTAIKLTSAALPLIRKSNSGRIIMISSVTGGLMAMQKQPIYATAKAAMLGLTRSIALDEARYGITCNAVLPGWIATDTQNDAEARQGLTTPLGRNGTPDEVASLVAWLASDRAGYVTGQSIVMDGGNSIAEERN